MLSVGVVNRRVQNVGDGDLDLLREGARMLFLVTTGGCKNCCTLVLLVMTVKVKHCKQKQYFLWMCPCGHVDAYILNINGCTVLFHMGDSYNH